MPDSQRSPGKSRHIAGRGFSQAGYHHAAQLTVSLTAVKAIQGAHKSGHSNMVP